MSTKNRTAVPDIGNLLQAMSKKRDSGELTKTPIQSVQPIEVKEEKLENSLELKSKNSKTLKIDQEKKLGGRPSVKVGDKNEDYTKISPVILKTLKKRVGLALLDAAYQDGKGRSITTLDEIVALALDTLLKAKGR